MDQPTPVVAPGELVATAQRLLARFEEPIQLIQALAHALEALAPLLHRQDELNEQLVSIADDVRRAQAESVSRVKEYEQREAQADQRYHAAEASRQRDLATLEQTVATIKADITALKTERQALRDALQEAREEHARGLAVLAGEKRAAEQAAATAREKLAKIREGIPA
ncbi:MAG: hypothetical protein AAB922_01120 [Patescibacteria group bacterium]